MPTARESLLDAARAALEREPWSGIRMVRVASDAGVSRQTLYNEFGDKSGLARALVRRQLAGMVAEVEERLRGAEGASCGDALRGLTECVVRAARGDKLLRASLTGCRCAGAPIAPQPPDRLLSELRDRAARILAARFSGEPDLGERCETAVRLAISQLVVPSAPPSPRRAADEPPYAVTGAATAAGTVTGARAATGAGASAVALPGAPLATARGGPR